MVEKIKNSMPDWLKYIPLILALMSAVFFYSESTHKTDHTNELLRKMDNKLTSLVIADKEGLVERQNNFHKLSLIEQRLGMVERKVDWTKKEIRELHKREERK